jgi:8-oxo-dGTP pyrophosphatase MutT (NUDIX family)
MWFLLGFFLGWWTFADSGIQGAGVILANSKNELLLVQNARSGRWGFPKGTYESEDLAYYFTAIREMEEETTFRLKEDYILESGSCRYGHRLYFYGKLIEDQERIPKINKVFGNEHRDIGWFDRESLPTLKNKDLLDWISDGMPSRCYHHDDL